MIIDIDVLLDYGIPERHDVLLQVEAAAMADQRLIQSHLTVTSPERLRAVEGEESIGQRTWAAGLGQFRVEYRAKVEIDRAPVDLSNMQANDPRMLPALVVPYLLPSRYCESDKFEAFVTREFSRVEGGQKILAMLDWMATHVDYVSGSSSGDTTAAGTFVQRQGVCRDFAHLLASMSRAAMIPARLVAAYAPGVTPPDFHAVVEIWLDGSWHLVDATGMAKAEEIVRIGVGRDATDIAFMTVFGSAQMFEQRVTVTRG
ncbi:MAG: transglutaminase family protein [Sphingomonadales bacterium]|nr:transglutaminase family protein [Sphingomonadales bacterium]